MARNSRRRSSGARRKSQWGFGGISDGTLASSPGTSVVGNFWLKPLAGYVDSVSAEIPTISAPDTTLVRMDGNADISYWSQGTENAFGLYRDTYFGLGVIAWDGVSEDPLPFDEQPWPISSAGLDWCWHWAFPVTGMAAAQTSSHGVSQVFSGPLISKAMRKLSAGTGLLACYEMRNDTSATSADIIFVLGGFWRFLLKLP